MPRTFWLFSIRYTTTIIVVDSLSNLNMIQGDLRHIDRSTTITNRDAFNVELESTITEQPLPSTSTTSPGKVVIESWSIYSTDLYGYVNPPASGISRPLRCASWTWYKQNFKHFRLETNFDAPLKLALTCRMYLPEMPSNLPDTRGSRPVEMAVSVHSTVRNSSTIPHVFMLTSIPSGEDFTSWFRWTRMPFHHSTDQEE